MRKDFDIAALDEIFDLLPEATCAACNAIYPARNHEYLQIREGKISPEQWARMGGSEPYGYSYDDIDPAVPEFRCLACGEGGNSPPILEFPFEHDDFLHHLSGISSALKAFPPFVDYGAIDPYSVPIGNPDRPFPQSYDEDQQAKLDPYDALIGACERAKWRVHFMTWTVDEDFIIELRQLADKNGIIVRGIVGVEHRTGRGRLKPEVGPQFSLLVAKDADAKHLYSHTKLVVIDGVAAIKGSANLRRNSFRGMAETPPKELIEAVTSIRQVQSLNNRIFAPVWADLIKKYRQRGLV